MLSLFPPETNLKNGAQLQLEQLQTSTIGSLWRITAGDRRYEVDLPIIEGSIMRYRDNVFAMAALAMPNEPLIRQRFRIGDDEPIQIDTEMLLPDDYVYLTAREFVQIRMMEILERAFDPRFDAKPHWIREQVMRMLRDDTVFMQLDRVSQRGQFDRTVMFQDHALVAAWQAYSGNLLFRRSSAFAGLIDFLTSQDENALHKGFLVEGVKIENMGLTGRGSSMMIDLSWRTPLGNSMSPVRSLINRSARTEAVVMKYPERPIVDWHPDDHALELVEGSPTDQKPSPNPLPGVNARVALVTWPGWLYKDAILISQSFAERAKHSVELRQTFWSTDGMNWIDGDRSREEAAGPPTGFVQSRQVIAIDRGRPIKAPAGLLAPARVDIGEYKAVRSLSVDPRRERIVFNLDPMTRETETQRHRVSLAERNLTLRQFLEARKLEGSWSVQILPSNQTLQLDDKLDRARFLEAVPVESMIRHSLVYKMDLPLTTGCKIATRAAYKGIVRVVDDWLMPEGIDMLIAQENVPSRDIAPMMLGEMALSSRAAELGCMALAGRLVTPQQVLEAAGSHADARQVEFPNRLVRFVGRDGIERRGRISINTSQFGETTLYSVEAEDGSLHEIFMNEFVSVEQGEPLRVQAAVGYVFVMVMNRHPVLTSRVRPQTERGTGGLLQKGNGAIVLGVNELQVLKALGHPELAEYLGWFDPSAIAVFRNLIKTALGSAVKENDMREVYQILQAHGLTNNVETARRLATRIEQAISEEIGAEAPGEAEAAACEQQLRLMLAGFGSSMRFGFSTVEPPRHLRVSQVLAQQAEDPALRARLPELTTQAIEIVESGALAGDMLPEPWSIAEELPIQDGIVLDLHYASGEQGPAARVALCVTLNPALV